MKKKEIDFSLDYERYMHVAFPTLVADAVLKAEMDGRTKVADAYKQIFKAQPWLPQSMVRGVK